MTARAVAKLYSKVRLKLRMLPQQLRALRLLS
jgi:hypothetical protein